VPVLVILLIEVAVAIAIAAALLALRYRADRLALRRRVIVNMLDGTAYDGVLWARRGRLVILKDTIRHERGLEPTPVDGEVLIDRGRVDFLQVTPAGGA
jgi:hypothetical protein